TRLHGFAVVRRFGDGPHDGPSPRRTIFPATMPVLPRSVLGEVLKRSESRGRRTVAGRDRPGVVERGVNGIRVRCANGPAMAARRRRLPIVFSVTAITFLLARCR